MTMTTKTEYMLRKMLEAGVSVDRIIVGLAQEMLDDGVHTDQIATRLTEYRNHVLVAAARWRQ